MVFKHVVNHLVVGSSCVGITFPLGNIEYCQVSGNVIEYQLGWTDRARFSNNKNINSSYVDSNILTHSSPRSHIWTFIVGAHKNNKQNYCPCTSKDSRNAPSFVGNDYYCESGCPISPLVLGKFYTNDPLWDGHSSGWMIYHDIYQACKSNTLICRCNIVVLNTIAFCLRNVYWDRFHLVLRYCLLMTVSRSAVT